MKVKRKLGRLALIALVAGGVSSMATASIITQAVHNTAWETGTTWVGGVAPASSVDSAVLGLTSGATTISLQSDFILGADQTIRQQGGGWWNFNSGTLDVFGSVNFANGGRHFQGSGGGTAAKNVILRPGSEFNVGGAGYRVANAAFTTTWIADTDGVTFITAGLGRSELNGSAAVIDLTNYDLTNGSVIPLLSRARAGDTFSSVTVLGGYTGATIDYAYNGDTQIALIIPEPATLGLIGTIGTGLLAIRRLFLV